jgi:hypothetical protein
MSSRSAVACHDGGDDEAHGEVDVSGEREEEEREPEAATEGAAANEGEPLTAVAEPAVIDLRDGVDTVAAYEAEQARRAELAARTRR